MSEPSKREPWQVPVLMFCLYAFPVSVMTLGFALMLQWVWMAYLSFSVLLGTSGVATLILLRAAIGGRKP